MKIWFTDFFLRGHWKKHFGYSQRTDDLDMFPALFCLKPLIDLFATMVLKSVVESISLFKTQGWGQGSAWGSADTNPRADTRVLKNEIGSTTNLVRPTPTLFSEFNPIWAQSLSSNGSGWPSGSKNRSNWVSLTLKRDFRFELFSVHLPLCYC